MSSEGGKEKQERGRRWFLETTSVSEEAERGEEELQEGGSVRPIGRARARST